MFFCGDVGVLMPGEVLRISDDDYDERVREVTNCARKKSWMQ